MTTAERKQLAECMSESQSGALPGTVYELSRQLGRAIYNAKTPEHIAKLEALHKQSENARQLLIATHDELAEMYQTMPSDAKTGE